MRGFQQATAAAWRGIKYQCAALVCMAGIVYSALTTAHASVYDILVKKHIAVRWVFVVTLTGFNLAFALPLAVWIISGFAGEFVQFDALNLWQLTWVIWAAYFEVMRSCARYAQCSTDGVLAYTWAYFAYLSQHRDRLAFHVLFSSYLTAATMYQGSLSMSLLKASPVYRSVSPLACFYSFFCYGLALWAIGLNGGDDPGAPYGFIALWWLVVVAGYCLAWLANLYRCNHLLFAVLRCVVGLAVLGYAIGVIWPEFYTNAWEQLCALAAAIQQAYLRLVSTVSKGCARILMRLVPKAECTSDEPGSPCRRRYFKKMPTLQKKYQNDSLSDKGWADGTAEAAGEFQRCTELKGEILRSQKADVLQRRKAEMEEAAHQKKRAQAADPNAPTAAGLFQGFFTAVGKCAEFGIRIFTGGNPGGNPGGNQN